MQGLVVFVIASMIGSFLGMLSYRLPNGLSLLDPKRSICPKCNHQIAWYHNIPMVSYIILQGKCSYCNNKISNHYFFIELVTAIIVFLLYFKMGLTSQFLVLSGVFCILILLSSIDFQFKAVPDYLLIMVLVTAFLYEEFDFQSALIFAGGFTLLELFVTFYIQNIKAKITKNEALKDQKSMGEGDIPIAALIGGVLGVQLGVLAVMVGALSAMISAIYTLFTTKEIETPFIPFLSFGLFVTFIFDGVLLDLLGKITS